MRVALKLYVKIGDKYEELSALAVGANVSPIKKISTNAAIQKYVDTCTSQKCVKKKPTSAGRGRLMFSISSSRRAKVITKTYFDFSG